MSRINSQPATLPASRSFPQIAPSNTHPSTYSTTKDDQFPGYINTTLSSDNNDHDEILSATTSTVTTPGFDDYTPSKTIHHNDISLNGAPWMKEGILRFRKCDTVTMAKESKTTTNYNNNNRRMSGVTNEVLGKSLSGLLLNRSSLRQSRQQKKWKNVFAVVEKTQLKLFTFDHSSSNTSKLAITTPNPVHINPLSPPRRNSAPQFSHLGDGNWISNAKCVSTYNLMHSLAQTLPSNDNDSSFQGLWMLSVPNLLSSYPKDTILVFEAGTVEIANEFVITCNYWSAKLSVPPVSEIYSNIEYGWGHVLNLLPIDKNYSKEDPKIVKADLKRIHSEADNLLIYDWEPVLPMTDVNMIGSTNWSLTDDYLEYEQRNKLLDYLGELEQSLEKHNVLRVDIDVVFTPGGNNHKKAVLNWNKKKSNILKLLIQYKEYINALNFAILRKNDIEKNRKSLMNDIRNEKYIVKRFTIKSFRRSSAVSNLSYNNLKQ